MVTGWLNSACGIPIEHLPCPRPGGTVDQTKPAAGVLHTIEGSLESGLAVFKQHFAPTLAVGGRRIVQLVPLGQTAAALEHTAWPPTNSWARVQIEVEGHSRETPYRFEPQTEDTLARLLAALHLLDIVPLTRPFTDLMPAPPWATPYFIRRNAGKWGTTAGWYGHIDIPENSHWDPGALEWTPLLNKATAMTRVYKPHPAPKKLPHPKAMPAAGRRRLRPHGHAGTLTAHPV